MNNRELAAAKAEELTRIAPDQAWGALASMWARQYVLAMPAWLKWPEHGAIVAEAMRLALARAGGSRVGSAAQPLLHSLDTFEINDDGSAEWQHAIDLVAMLADVLRNEDLRTCAQNAITWFLDGLFIVMANELASASGRPISHADALDNVVQSERWRRSLNFVRSL